MSDRDNVADIMDAVVIYENDMKKTRKSDLTDEEIEIVDGMISAKHVKVDSSSDDQLTELSNMIIKGEGKEETRKQVIKILKSGDPIVESKAVMVALARRELQTLIKTTDAVSKIDDIMTQRVLDGLYDDASDIKLMDIAARLERSMSRSLTVVDKIVSNPEYSEFLMAYRDIEDTVKLGNITTIATNKDTREKVKNLAVDIIAKMNKELKAKTKDNDNKENESS